MAMQKITEAILEKVRLEAQQITKDAEVRAQELLDASAKQHEQRFEEEKNLLLSEAEREAARIFARSAIEARQELSVAKAKVVGDIIEKVKKSLSGISIDDASFTKLIKNSLKEFGEGEVVVYVAAKDISPVLRIVAGDKDLAATVQDVQPYNCLGGVLVEGTGGKNRIDNTYDTRLEKLMPQILPEINKEFFKV